MLVAASSDHQARRFFVVFGTLSDRIGTKPIILAGMLLAVVTLLPAVPGLAPKQPARIWPCAGDHYDRREGRPGDLLLPGSGRRPRGRLHQRLRHRQARPLAQNSASYSNREAPAGSGAVIASVTRSRLPPTGVLTAGSHKVRRASGKAIAQFRRT